MDKIRVVGDSSSNPYHSSSIIINSINKAAKELGIYDENGLTCVYDTLCNNHGYKDIVGFYCAYELPFPKPILDNAGGKPIIGLSRDNAWFAIEGGYPRELVNHCTLGVDTSIWSPQSKNFLKDKFVVLCMTESTVRSGLECLIPAFGEVFSGNKDVVLYIKDREPTETFKQYVRSMSEYYNIEIIHDPRHLEDHEEEKKILQAVDCHFYLNHSATFAMTVLQSMACGIPTVSIRHSGPTDYLSHDLTGLAVEYDLKYLEQSKLDYLVQIGQKNFLFPLNCYQNRPYWAEPRKDSIKKCLTDLYESKELREKLIYNGIRCGQTLSWKRTAWNLQFVLNEFQEKS